MKTALVTGGNGHLGLTLSLMLKERGYRVRVTARRDIDLLKAHGFEVFVADLLNRESLDRACQGVDFLFHTAAPNPPNHFNREQVVNSTFLGTQNIFEAAANAQVKHFVFTSSCGALGFQAPKDRDLDESDWNQSISHPGVKAKAQAEEWVVNFAASRGLVVDRINLPVMLGPGSLHSTASIEPIRLLASGKRMMFPLGVMHIIDVRDAAEAHVLAAERGFGERWVVAGDRVSSVELAKLIRQVHPNAKMILKPLPNWVVRMSAFVIPGLSSEWVTEWLNVDQRVNSNKARHRLHWKSRPLETTLRDTFAWFSQAIQRDEKRANTEGR